MFKKVQVWIASQRKGQSPQYLLFKLIPQRGGGWHPVTGGVDKGEALFAAAKRETLEETGIDPDAGTWVDLEHSHSFDGRRGKSEEHAFGLVLKNQKITIHLDPSELTEFKWVSFEEAKEQLGHDPQRRALELFSCYFEKHGSR